MAEITATVPKPTWMDGNNLDEVQFCKEFREQYPIKCVYRRFFTPDGLISDEEELKKRIYDLLKPHIKSNLTKRVNSLMELLRIECHSEEFPIQLDRIHVANGTLFLDGRFTEEKEFCRNRLPVAYHPGCPKPKLWLKFLSELLEPEDILTLQEYMGYCLIPSTKAQKMLIILGNGGEGKSRIGLIMGKLLGAALLTSSIQKIETNRFARADLEYILVVIDDDLELIALPKTSILKTLITAEGKIDMERKGEQSYQRQPYTKIIGFGNGALTAQNDQSLGFYRRQLVLYTKAPAPGRKNDPYLVEKMVPELEGIFLWCLEGLQRLLKNNYQFTVSKKAEENVCAIQQNVNNVEAFLQSTGYIAFDLLGSASSKDLLDLYRQFCIENAYQPVRDRTFSSEMSRLAEKYHLRYTNNIYLSDNRRVRGYEGVRILFRPIIKGQ